MISEAPPAGAVKPSMAAPSAASPATAAAPPKPNSALSAIVFTRDRSAEGVIRHCLGNLISSAEFINGNIDVAIKQLAQRASPRLLIVDVTGSSDPVAEIKSLAQVCYPGTGVIVIGERNDISLYRELLQSGIVEYFFKPLVTTLVTRAASEILTGSVVKSDIRTGKLIVVAGVRGGNGATTTAVNSAWFLAVKCHRRVALLDLDLFAGDAALQLNAVPTHALSEALEHPERVDDLFLDRATIRVTERFSLMASLEDLDKPVALNGNSVLSLLERLLDTYRYVFVDVPTALAPFLLPVMHLPGICVLVSDGSLVAARDVARWRAIIGESSAERQFMHILNKDGAPGALAPAEFLRAAGHAPDLTIPYDRNIAVASGLGIEAVHACPTLQRGLGPLFSLMSGQVPALHHSLLERMRARLLPHP